VRTFEKLHPFFVVEKSLNQIRYFTNLLIFVLLVSHWILGKKPTQGVRFKEKYSILMIERIE